MNKICITFFGFINFYILIRVLTKEDFGAWVLFTSIASLMELIKHGFVRNPLIRYLTISSAAESAKIQTASLLLNIIIGLVQVVVLYFCSIYLGRFWSSPQLESLFRSYMISTIAQMTAIFIACFVSFRYARPFLELSRRLDRSWFRELHSYGVFTFGTNVSSMINKSVDSWILGKLISPAAVTIFNPAIRISNLVEVPTDTLTSILFPKLSERIATEGPRAAKYLYEKAVGTITAIMIPVIFFFIVFAGPVIRFVAGPGFAETVPILRVY